MTIINYLMAHLWKTFHQSFPVQFLHHFLLREFQSLPQFLLSPHFHIGNLKQEIGNLDSHQYIFDKSRINVEMERIQHKSLQRSFFKPRESPGRLLALETDIRGLIDISVAQLLRTQISVVQKNLRLCLNGYCSSPSTNSLLFASVQLTRESREKKVAEEKLRCLARR